MTRLLIATAAAAVGVACVRPDPEVQRVRVTIPAGATWSEALDTLTSRGIVRWRLPFDLAGRLRGAPESLKSGTYALRPGERWSTIFAALASGRGVEARLVVPEGLMLTEVAAAVERELEIPRDSFAAAARDTAILAALQINAPSLEGYLYPETYQVPEGITARRLAELMAREFLERWDPGWDARVDSLGLTRHEAVTLASIIEGEARDPLDRPFVSAVYHNRLRIGMPLQADPTVIYALGVRRRLFIKDYEVDHPYNTYRMRGLPPGPIGSPGAASLEAALHPANVPYLYLVARPDGKHIFSRTLAEHAEARAAVRAMWRAPGPPPGGDGGPPPRDPERR